MKYRVEDLAGALLDAAVAKAEGLRYAVERFAIKNPDPERHMTCWLLGQDGKPDFKRQYSPHADWSLGGPLLERHDIMVRRMAIKQGDGEAQTPHFAFMCKDPAQLVAVYPAYADASGPDYLTAGMRALVKVKLGEEIEL